MARKTSGSPAQKGGYLYLTVPQLRVCRAHPRQGILSLRDHAVPGNIHHKHPIRLPVIGADRAVMPGA